MSIAPTVPPVPDTFVPARAGAASLGAAGVLFAAYPALRPWVDESTPAAAEAFTSPAWVVAHLAAVVALALLPLGALGVWSAVRSRLASAGALALWGGAALVLPYYGAEIFGLRAIALTALARSDVSLLAIVETVRLDPAAATVFATGLLLVAAGGVLLGLAVARSSLEPAWAGWPLAAALVLLLPQFFAPPALRIAHGALFALGCLTLAAALLRRR